MPLNLRITTRLVTCGTCGKPKGITHTCVTRLDKPRPAGRAKVQPKLSVTVKCPKCHKPYTSPLTHVCTVKTDFRKRLKASKKKPRKPAHRYSACRDPDCQRQPCVAYKDGYEDGAAAAGRS